jgi:hypothetical protein
MSKKILMSLAPLLVMSAFAVMPAMASARVSYGTETGGVFTAFANGTAVPVTSKKAGAAEFILENVAKTAGIECSSLEDKGIVENTVVGGVATGNSALVLVFDGCKGTGLLAGCVPNRTGLIAGEVEDEVKTETTVEVKIKAGFDIRCGGTDLGSVTGAVTGTQAKKSDILTFTEAGGLTFRGEPATITGSDETTQNSTGKGVVI